MKTKRQFLNNINNSEFKNLYSAVIEAGGVEWEDLTAFPTDYTDPAGGNVGGLMWYDDTAKFAKANIEDILKLYLEFCDDVGYTPIHKDTPLNWLAWFVWESMMTELIDFLENDELENDENENNN